MVDTHYTTDYAVFMLIDSAYNMQYAVFSGVITIYTTHYAIFSGVDTKGCRYILSKKYKKRLDPLHFAIFCLVQFHFGAYYKSECKEHKMHVKPYQV